MRRINLKDDFHKLKTLISQRKFGELKTRILQITPGINRIRSKFIIKQLRRKYSKFVDEYSSQYNYVQGGGGHKNIIWWLWLQGVDEAPEICKACLASLRRWHPEKEIITLDKNNLSQYITLPDYITKKYEKGKIIPAHYSDMIRLQLFIVSDPGNPILMLNRDLLFEYWREHNYYTHYFIFNIFFEMAAEKFRSEYDKMPFLSYEPQYLLSSKIRADEDYSYEMLDELAELSDWHKLTYKKVTDNQMLPSKIIPNLIKLYE